MTALKLDTQIANDIRAFELGNSRFVLHIPSLSIIPATEPVGALADYLVTGNPGAARIIESVLKEAAEGLEKISAFRPPTIAEVGKEITQLAISPTLNCNLNCTYCYNYQERPSKDLRRFPDLGRDGIRKILRTLSELPFGERVNLAFIGGEPFLHPERLRVLCRLALRIAARRGIGVKFLATTNGLNLSNPKVKALILDFGFVVSISLDGPRAWHNESRLTLSNTGSYDRISKSIEAFMDYYPGSKGVRATHKLEPGRIIGTYRHLVAMGFTDIAMGSADFVGRSLNAAERKQVLSELEELAAEIENDVILGRLRRHSWFTEAFINLYFGNPKQVICGATRNHVAFDVYGSMQACHRYLGNRDYELTAADILDPSNSELVTDIRSHSKTEHCGTCWARTLCGGECFHVSKELNKTDHEKDRQDFLCDYKRKKFDLALKMYVSLWNRDPRLVHRLATGEDEADIPMLPGLMDA